MNQEELLGKVNVVFAEYFEVPDDAITFTELEWTTDLVILKTARQQLYCDCGEEYYVEGDCCAKR